jgi:phosphate:Na+ symporter
METHLLVFLLQLAGAAALLLWSVRLIRTGVERAFSVHLRRWLRLGSDRLPLAAATGAVSAIMLQSATAVALLVSNFVGAGALTVAAGLAILLGADFGSAVVARILLVRVDWLVPLLLLCGVALFLRGERPAIRQPGRMLVGLALVFTSLAMIRAATAPLGDSEILVNAMAYLGGDPATAFVLGALIAWLMHSSVAMVLLVITMASQGLIPIDAAIALILGANLGSGIIAVVLTLKAPVAARRIVAGNLVIRGGGAVATLAALTLWAPPLDVLGAAPAEKLINLNLAFNLGVALLGLPFAHLAARALEALIAERADPSRGLGRTSALDPTALEEPERALACAARELLSIGETIEAMLRPVMRLYQDWDDNLAASIRAQEKIVSRMHFETKLYLANLNRKEPDEGVANRGMRLSGTAINLEAAGGAIAKSMLDMALQMHQEGLKFSDSGWRELSDLHDRVLSNVQLALNVLMTGDHDSARQLMGEKEKVRAIERDMQAKHLNRLRQGTVESIETSNIHQETIRALKQVNTVFSMIAYPILSETGELLESRLATSGKAD